MKVKTFFLFQVVLFNVMLCKVVLTFEFLNKIPKCGY